MLPNVLRFQSLSKLPTVPAYTIPRNSRSEQLWKAQKSMILSVFMIGVLLVWCSGILHTRAWQHNAWGSTIDGSPAAGRR